MYLNATIAIDGALASLLCWSSPLLPTLIEGRYTYIELLPGQTCAHRPSFVARMSNLKHHSDLLYNRTKTIALVSIRELCLPLSIRSGTSSLMIRLYCFLTTKQTDWIQQLNEPTELPLLKFFTEFLNQNHMLLLLSVRCVVSRIIWIQSLRR